MHKTAGELRSTTTDAEEGFLLAGLIVAIFLLLLTLSIAAPRIAYDLRRDREVEAVHRGNQYVRAIQVYYKKFGHYPGSLEQLQKTNNIRFLRQNYVDPITGKQDYRLIPVGQNQTTVKGFFGQPLAGLAGGGLGSVAGMVSPGVGGSTGGIGSSVGANGTVGASGTPGAAGATGASGANGASGATGSTGSFGSFGSPSPIGGGSTGGGTPFMGVGLGTGGSSILAVNEQTSYDTWEFLYDPRIELLKAKAGLNGANAGSVGAGQLGQTPGGIGTSTNSLAPTGPLSPTSPNGGPIPINTSNQPLQQ